MNPDYEKSSTVFQTESKQQRHLAMMKTSRPSIYISPNDKRRNKRQASMGKRRSK